MGPVAVSKGLVTILDGPGQETQGSPTSLMFHQCFLSLVFSCTIRNVGGWLCENGGVQLRSLMFQRQNVSTKERRRNG